MEQNIYTKEATTNLSPDRPTEVSQEDDFVPEGGTDESYWCK